MICKELNKEFDSKPAMFEALKANKELIIKEKKSQIFKSCEKGLGLGVKPWKPKFPASLFSGFPLKK